MDQQESKKLILRDRLAIDRTHLANQRTFLSFLRTSLYFVLAGLSIYTLEWLEPYQHIAWVFFVFSLFFFILGIINYYKNARKINRAYSTVKDD